MTLEDQIIDLRKKYPYLYKDTSSLKGTVFIEKDEIKDDYEIEIFIPDDYSKSIPYVKEIGGKIAVTFHHNPDGTLCLETPLAILEIFRQEETLLNFVDNLIVPYLYSYSYYQLKGQMPFGEWAHGTNGIIADYKERFKIADDIVILNLLRILVEDCYRGHFACPCGSQQKLRKCHGPSLLKMKTIGYNFMSDYIMIMYMLNTQKQTNISSYASTRVMKVLKEMSGDLNAKRGS